MLAHQGGWDEALFVVIPALVIVGLLWLARRRAERIGDRDARPAAGGDHDTRDNGD